MQKMKSLCSRRSEEYDKETPQSQTTDQPTEPQGIIAKQNNSVKTPCLGRQSEKSSQLSALHQDVTRRT